METESHEGRKQINIGPPWSLALIPVLLLAWPFSTLFSLASGRIRRQRGVRFQALMKARNRAIEWKDFVAAMGKNRGTLVAETASLGSAATLMGKRTSLDSSGTLIAERASWGSSRWWWTPDNLYVDCPYPIADWLTMREDTNFDRFSKWCHQRYTSPDTGGAFLVCDAPSGEVRTFWNRLTSGEGRWVEVVQFDLLPRKRRSIC
jgi:hypothetical protein